MTIRERFLAVVNFEQPDYVPYWYAPGIGLAHPETVARWQAEERYPSDFDSLVEFWGAEGYYTLPLNIGFVPPVPIERLDLGDGYVLIKQGAAQTRELADNADRYTMPQFVTYMIEGRRHWEEEFLPRLNPHDPARAIPNLEAHLQAARASGQPVLIPCPSYFGHLRSWFGLDRVSYLMYDDPALIHEINRAFTDVFLAQADKVAGQIQIDALGGWEDMCYRSGMMISPDAFREFCTPYYREVAGFARDVGAAVVDIDCDGDVTELVACLWEAGVNMCHAFEPTHGGSDILALREAFPRFIICGGLNKYAMDAPDPAAALAEVDAKVPPMLRRGGYLPSIDHGLGPLAHYRNFWHFMNRIREHCGAPPAPFQEIGPPAA